MCILCCTLLQDERSQVLTTTGLIIAVSMKLNSKAFYRKNYTEIGLNLTQTQETNKFSDYLLYIFHFIERLNVKAS